MKVTYDQESDTMTITLREERIRESDEVRPGVIADFGYDGGIVRFEILQFVEKLAQLSFRGALGDEESRIACIFRARFLAALGMTWLENVFQQTA